MKYFIRYKYSRNGTSWTHTSAIVNATTDYMAERIIQGRHPGCDVEIEDIQER
jgi:hypothetical protein